MITLLFLVLVATEVFPAARPVDQAGASPHPLLAGVAEAIRRAELASIDLRRELHQHPDLSGQEERTARVVAARMRDLGLDVTTGVGGHGVVAVLTGAHPGPTIAFRADMDASRSTDPDPAEPRSVVPGVRHQCGHDVHVAVAAALAAGFAAVRADLPGTVIFVFQPAEETGTGAKAMLADGVFRQRPPVAIYAIHSSPFETGTLATREGPMMPAIDGVRFVLSGDGDFDAAAKAVRTLAAAVSTIGPSQMYQSVPHDFALVSVGQPRVQGRTARMTGIVRLAGAESRERVREALERGAGAIQVPGVSVAIEYEAKQLAGVTNDAQLTAQAVASLTAAYGPSAIQPYKALLPGFSEDFGFFQDEIPGTFLFLGVSNAQKGIVGMPHAPDFAADDAAIAFGARAIAAVMLDRLSRQEGLDLAQENT